MDLRQFKILSKNLTSQKGTKSNDLVPLIFQKSEVKE